MLGRGSSNHCVCLCVCYRSSVRVLQMLKAKVRYQQKALNAGNKINVGIEKKNRFESYDSY